MPLARYAGVRFSAAACLLAVLGSCSYALAGGGQAPSIAAFERAQGLRQTLEAAAEAERSRADYERVLNAYRAVYHGDPGSARADDSIVAVAELLAEEGRVFHSAKDFRDAIGQYEFLRRQYPYSRYRFSALLAEGEIYEDGLADRGQAAATFEDFLRTYPGSPLAQQARDALTDLREEGPADSGAQPLPLGNEQARGPAAEPGRERAASTNAAPRATAATEAASPASDSEDRASAGNDTAGDAAADASAPGGAPSGRPTRVTAIRYWSHPTDSRIAINLEEPVKYVSARIARPNRIYFDLRGARLGAGLKEKSIAIGGDALLTRIRAAQFSPDVTRIVLDVSPGADYNAFFLPNPWRLIIDVHQPKKAATLEAQSEAPLEAPAGSASRAAVPHSARPGSRNELEAMGAPAAANTPPPPEGFKTPYIVAHMAPGGTPQQTAEDQAENQPGDQAQDRTDDQAEDFPPVREAEPTADGGRSLARTLGLKVGRIVIDAGHGGYDCGSIGPGGLEEKNITLDVALRLGKLLKNRLGADVIYTRRDDTFIPLETRTAIANQAHADLFISIHANSSSDPQARGVESYYLNFTTAPDALEVAARENADSGESIANLSDLVKEIALKDKIEESREFAADVQRALYSGLAPGNPGFKNRGVKKAPFVVLIGANMPSILAEISFLTNPDDARELRQPRYRQRIAESLYRGVAQYINGLNGVRLAENGLRPGN